MKFLQSVKIWGVLFSAGNGPPCFMNSAPALTAEATYLLSDHAITVFDPSYLDLIVNL